MLGRYLALGAALLIVAGCGRVATEEAGSGSAAGQAVVLATEDGVTLKASFYPKESNNAVILVHMLNSNRQSYNEFALRLNRRFGVLSVDSRGHGESDLDWNDFSEKDFNSMVLDVKAAKAFLSGKGFSEVYLVGASIGANTVLNYAAADDSIKKIVLLSPGLNYRGVSTGDSVREYKNKVLIVASGEDSYSFASSEKLFEESPGEKRFLRLSNAGHGTSMFAKPGLMDEIIGWLAE